MQRFQRPALQRKADGTAAHVTNITMLMLVLACVLEKVGNMVPEEVGRA